MASRGRLLWFQNEVNSIVSLDDKTCSSLGLCPQWKLSDEFIISLGKFKCMMFLFRAKTSMSIKRCLLVVTECRVPSFVIHPSHVAASFKKSWQDDNDEVKVSKMWLHQLLLWCNHLLYTIHASDAFIVQEMFGLKWGCCTVCTWSSLTHMKSLDCHLLCSHMGWITSHELHTRTPAG